MGGMVVTRSMTTGMRAVLRVAWAMGLGAALLAGSVAAEGLPAGTWLGALDIRDGGDVVATRALLDLDGTGGAQTGELRLSAPFDCDIAFAFVTHEAGTELYNVSHTTPTGFCRRYDSGQLRLTSGSGDDAQTLDLTLDDAHHKPDWRQEGRLARDES